MAVLHHKIKVCTYVKTEFSPLAGNVKLLTSSTYYTKAIISVVT